MARLLTWLLTILMILLPFHVFISVFMGYQVWVPGFVYVKELVLMAAAFVLVLLHFRHKRIPQIDTLDIAILLYVLVLVIVSIVNGVSLTGMMFGLRYDAEFLFAFLVARHSVPFLTVSSRTILMRFVYSALLALLIWFLVKFVFSESILVLFWFSESVSQWEVWWAPPIYHGIPGANVQRFQGIWDGPNQAGFFLTTLLGIFIHAMPRRNDYNYLIGLVGLFIVVMLVLTYSRSAFLWVIWGWCVFIISYIIRYFREHPNKKFWDLIRRFGAPVWVGFLLLLIVVGGFIFVNRWKLDSLIGREWSTNAHVERFLIWFERFKANPMWSWLASAWPAARSVHEVVHTDHGEFVAPEESVNALSRRISDKAKYHIFSSEAYYIPESWWMQQLVEWWIVWFLLFFSIMLMIGLRSLVRSPWLVFAFMGVLIMNCVLHSFETMYASLALFMALGLIIDSGRKVESASHSRTTS